MMDSVATTDFDEPDNNSSSTNGLLPQKSLEKYHAAYNKFIDWKKAKNIEEVSESILMHYFTELSRNVKPTTLWAHYSMLKSTLNQNDGIDIKDFKKITEFLKQQSVGFKSKQAKILTPDQVEKFLDEAPDEQYLATKVVLIFGITGSCRRDELCNIKMKDIQDYNSSMMLVKIPRNHPHVSRSFTITDKFYKIVKKYTALRPPHTKCDRFFLNYQHGKCTIQPIGINKFGNLPKQIATYLNLPEPESYTGHSFRRTSTALLADAGITVRSIRKRRSHQFSTEEENDDEVSGDCKKRLSGQITQTIYLPGFDESSNHQSEQSEESSHYSDESNLSNNVTNDGESPKIKIKKRVSSEGEGASEEEELDNERDPLSSQNITTTINEQNFDFSSEVKLPNKHITLNISNCSNISLNFYEK